jgi:hypothetical protein
MTNKITTGIIVGAVILAGVGLASFSETELVLIEKAEEFNKTEITNIHAEQTAKIEYEQKYEKSLDQDISQRVDVYNGPEGKGYVVITSFIKGGDTFQKSENFGPEKWRGYDWSKLEKI